MIKLIKELLKLIYIIIITSLNYLKVVLFKIY